MKFFSKINSLVFMITLPIVVLLSIVQIYTFNPNFYHTEFFKYSIPKATGIEMGDLDKITKKMISYLKDQEENLNIEVKIKGEMEEAFGKREKDHMVDVKKMFQRGYTLRNMSLFLFVISLMILLKEKANIYIRLIYGSGASLLTIGILVILIKIDFYKYFTHFHEIFFTNDLWLLNPKEDVLIQMLPLEFFTDISTRVFLWFIGVKLTLAIFSFALGSNKNRDQI